MGHLLLLLVKLSVYNLTPIGKSIKGYGTHRVSFDRLEEDWSELFGLLERKITPVIAERLSLLEAVRANELLEDGRVTGNVVLVSSVYLRASVDWARLAR